MWGVDSPHSITGRIKIRFCISMKGQSDGCYKSVQNS
jgi:hypothetical protein